MGEPRPNHLAALCCLAHSAMASGHMPGAEAAQAACRTLADAWARRRRAAWPTVSEHVRGLRPLRRALRLTRLVDAVLKVPQPARSAQGRSLHSFKNNYAIVHSLFHDPRPRALIWEGEPCVLLVRVRDGVWAARASRGEERLLLCPLPSVRKALQFVGPPPPEGSVACAALEPARRRRRPV